MEEKRKRAKARRFRLIRDAVLVDGWMRSVRSRDEDTLRRGEMMVMKREEDDALKRR